MVAQYDQRGRGGNAAPGHRERNELRERRGVLGIETDRLYTRGDDRPS